jgi:hypothetical protein
VAVSKPQACVILGFPIIFLRGKGGIMAGFDKEQLAMLKRQLEEDFRMDIAAIERLERRFTGGVEKAPISAAVAPVIQSPGHLSVVERNGTNPSRVESAGQIEPDELSSSLRSMFSNYK